MKPVTSIYSKLGMASYYYYAVRNMSIPEWSGFYWGATVVWVVPPLVCSIVLGDPLPLEVFTMVATLGSLLGIMMFNTPFVTVHCVPLDRTVREAAINQNDDRMIA
jgi:hypothetical protein